MFKIGDKVKIIGSSENDLSIEKLKEYFPDLVGYVNYVSDNIVEGKTYVIINLHHTSKSEAFGWGFIGENLKKI